ncbi:hypothetical protein [Paenibacillus abyssi]|nr:hypothetical protein [Paenibacillus abyssi]
MNGRTEARTLAELLAEYTQEVARLRTTIINAMVPKIDEKGAM